MMNKVKIRITGYPERMLNNPLGGLYSEESSAIKLWNELKFLVKLRAARNIGDEETINHTMLGKLKDSGIPFEIVK